MRERTDPMSNAFSSSGRSLVIVFILRSRLGIDVARFQFGVGADVRRTTGSTSDTTANVGVFTRHAF